MLTILALLSLPSQADAKQLLIDVEKHYRELNSFSMTIEHSDSSGLFPGSYSQVLRWKKVGRFDLVVTKPSDYRPKDGSPGWTAPDYFCDSKKVTSIHPSRGTRTEAVVPDANTSPGWEVSGGLILSWLMDLPGGKFLVAPPSPMKVDLGIGPETTWQGSNIRQITAVLRMDGQPERVTGSFFLDAKELKLVGFSFEAGSQKGWARYANQIENPKFDSEVGLAPK